MAAASQLKAPAFNSLEHSTIYSIQPSRAFKFLGAVMEGGESRHKRELGGDVTTFAIISIGNRRDI